MENKTRVLHAQTVPEEPMPRTKLEGFKRQFPWIYDYAKEGFTRAFISRIDESVLTLDAGCYGQFPCTLRPEKRIFLLNAAGRLVCGEYSNKFAFEIFGRVFRPKTTARSTAILGINETIGGALFRLGKLADDVKYIVWYLPFSTPSSYDNPVPYWSPSGGLVIIYKAPKDIPLGQLLEQKTNRAQSHLAEIETNIDQNR